uniref:Uncharacterized protein n=1 Tax=Lotharella globosa TaxID=91324 RepID=A0A7S4DR12_9EUKA
MCVCVDFVLLFELFAMVMPRSGSGYSVLSAFIVIAITQPSQLLLRQAMECGCCLHNKCCENVGSCFGWAVAAGWTGASLAFIGVGAWFAVRVGTPEWFYVYLASVVFNLFFQEFVVHYIGQRWSFKSQRKYFQEKYGRFFREGTPPVSLTEVATLVMETHRMRMGDSFDRYNRVSREQWLRYFFPQRRNGYGEVRTSDKKSLPSSPSSDDVEMGQRDEGGEQGRHQQDLHNPPRQQQQQQHQQHQLRDSIGSESIVTDIHKPSVGYAEKKEDEKKIESENEETEKREAEVRLGGQDEKDDAKGVDDLAQSREDSTENAGKVEETEKDNGDAEVTNGEAGAKSEGVEKQEEADKGEEAEARVGDEEDSADEEDHSRHEDKDAAARGNAAKAESNGGEGSSGQGEKVGGAEVHDTKEVVKMVGGECALSPDEKRDRIDSANREKGGYKQAMIITKAVESQSAKNEAAIENPQKVHDPTPPLPQIRQQGTNASSSGDPKSEQTEDGCSSNAESAPECAFEKVTNQVEAKAGDVIEASQLELKDNDEQEEKNDWTFIGATSP